jgi:riboflavin kinase/FMN adenylyltransferase
MRIIEDATKIDTHFPKLVLTIGSFDGVHVGHRHLLKQLVTTAHRIKGTAAVMTMRPHPRELFSPNSAPNILTADAKKEALLADSGVDVLYILPFTQEVSQLSPLTFFEHIVVKQCRAKVLLVGHDFAFGKDASGTYEMLAEIAPRYDVEVHQIPPLYLQGERVSSSIIRASILQGDLEQAAFFLGRKYSMLGQVMAGRGIGRQLGFPTANIEPHHNSVPAHGVYVAEALVGDTRYMAAVNIGIAPTVRQEDIKIEAYLLDFEGDLVGKEIELIFHLRLRPESKFSDLSELVKAIKKDVQAVRDYFAQSD